MTPNKLKEAVRAINRAIEAQDDAALRALIHEDYVHHRKGLERTFPLLLIKKPPPAGAKPVDGFVAASHAVTKVFSAWNAREDHLYVDGDTVIAHQTMSGRLKGTFPGATRTNPEFSFPMIVIFKFRDDKVCEIWALGDELGFWSQLGFPMPEKS